MIYKLVCAGDNHFLNLYKKDEDEIIIAIDGGYRVLIENNIKVDYFFGDFDSNKDNKIISEHIFSYPTIKDKGDFELAIDFLIKDLQISSLDKVIVYNATGGRLDHYYAILNVLKKYSNYNILLIDNNNLIQVKKNKFEISKKNYKYISFFSFNDETIISIKGCKYNIDCYHLKKNDNLCLSNEVISVCEVNVNHDVLIIQSN